MLTKHTIIINNNTGTDQSYSFSLQAPNIDDASVHTPIVYVESNVPDGAHATFELFTKYSVVTGASRGSLREGVSVRVVKTLEADGGGIKFSLRGGAPEIRRADGGGEDGVSLTTSSEFNEEDVERGNVFVGIGIDVDGMSQPFAVWAPQPGRSYHVQPSAKVIVSSSSRSLRAGDIVDPRKSSGRELTVDFDARPSDAQVKHDDQGRLVLQRF